MITVLLYYVALIFKILHFSAIYCELVITENVTAQFILHKRDINIVDVSQLKSFVVLGHAYTSMVRKTVA
jgi:hypothetical protein